MALRPVASACLIAWCAVASAAAAVEVPAQFSAWGTSGPELVPADGWTDTAAEPRIATPPPVTAQDRARGFIVFARRPFEAVYHDTVPRSCEISAPLQTVAAQGTYQPVTVALHALAALHGVTIAVSGCAGAGGAAIAAEHIDVRWVRPIRSAVALGNAADRRYRRVPFYLEKRDAMDVASGESAQLWLTVHVPESTPGGEYRGTVTVRAVGKEAAVLPLTIRVLPFRLPPVGIETVMSFPRPAADPALREKQMIDQREHGIDNVEAGVSAAIVSRDQHFGDDDVQATITACTESLRLRKKVFGPANRWPLTADIGHQILYFWDTQKNWFQYWPRSAENEADFFKAIDTVRTIATAEGVPLRLFIMDEPGGSPDMLTETIYYNALAKRRLPDLPTFVTIGGGIGIGVDEIGLLGPAIDLLTINRFSPTICRTLLARGKPYGIYNGGGATEQTTGYSRDRHFFGLYGWKTGASEILQWAYDFGEPWKNPIRGNDGYTYLAPDGPLPSIPWEGVRAGIDDQRTMDLLWRLITAARASKDAAAITAADAAENVARGILQRIGFDYQPQSGAGSPAPSAATLERWRWQLSEACLRLLKLVPLERALATAAKRPGPLDIPGPPTAAPVGMGEPLIADGGFENGLGPWKVMGKTVDPASVIDAGAHHGGTQGLRLVNAPGATGMDVVVCVWGWGGAGPSMTLEAGRTYEFSAWMSCRQGMPTLRVNLPDGAAHQELGGEDDAQPDGWQRHWLRVTMKMTAKPSYLAVWLQGPGDIRLDDLSLRERILPSFTIDADQVIVDGSDREVVIRLLGGTQPVMLAIDLPGEARPREMALVAGGREEISFDASLLPVGRHQVRGRLAKTAGTDAAAPAPASVVEIERIRGPFE